MSCYILDPSKSSFKSYIGIDEVLSNLTGLEDDNKWALSVSFDDDYQIHLKRNNKSSFINNYNPDLLKCWEAWISNQLITTLKLFLI